MREYIPKIFLQGEIAQTRAVTGESSMRLQRIGDSPEIPSFTNVMTDLVKDLDATVKAPDAVMESAVLGQGADIHDVMLAMSKAEVSLNIATQMTTKVIQAYEKIMAIQV